MRKFVIAAAAAVLIAGPAMAATVTVDGADWDISTFVGSMEDNIALLEMQEWWGDQDKAVEFVNAVEDSFGYPHFGGGWGPYFAHGFIGDLPIDEFVSSPEILACAYSSSALTAQCIAGFDDTGSAATYAVAIRVEDDGVDIVPLPAAFPMLLAGLAGLGLVARRRSN